MAHHHHRFAYTLLHTLLPALPTHYHIPLPTHCPTTHTTTPPADTLPVPHALPVCLPVPAAHAHTDVMHFACLTLLLAEMAGRGKLFSPNILLRVVLQFIWTCVLPQQVYPARDVRTLGSDVAGSAPYAH